MTEQEKETLQLYRRVSLLEKALEQIVEWQIKPVWDEKLKQPVSYLYGSNGERDHFRKVAEEAIEASHKLR